jgi:hypothetical protein
MRRDPLRHGHADDQSRVRPDLGRPDRAGDGGGDRHLVVVNLSGQLAQGRVPLGWADLRGRGWRLTDLLGDAVFERDGDELADPGLFVDLAPWQFHLLALRAR